ncbi:MAG: translocation/assembly module TamB domain-containing protein [Cellvibrionaceae bacterium]
MNTPLPNIDKATPKAEPKMASKLKLRSFVKYFIIALLVLLLIIALLTTWLSTTQSGLQWLSQRAISFSPELSIGNIKGRLIGPLSVDDLRYQTQEFDVNIKTINLDWQPSKLLLSTLVVNEITTSGIIFKQTAEPKEKPKDTSPPPKIEDIIKNLQLPISILINKAEINELVYDGNYYKRNNKEGNNENNNQSAKQEKSDSFVLDYFILAAKSDSQKIQINQLRLKSNVVLIDGSLTLGLSSSQGTSGDINWTLLPKNPSKNLPKKSPENSLPSIEGATQLSGDTQNLTINTTLKPPYASSLIISIEELIKKPFATVELNINEININKINADWPLYDLDGNINLKGDIDKAVFNSQFLIIDKTQNNGTSVKSNGGPTNKVTINSKGNWQNETLDMVLNADAPPFIESLNINSKVRPNQLNKPNSEAIKFDLNWKNINTSNVSTQSQPLLFSPEGQISLTGNLKQYEFKLNSLLETTFASTTGTQTQQAQKGKLIISGKGSDEKITLDQIALSGPMGSLNGGGDIKINAPIAANIQLLGKNLNPQFLSPQWPGKLDLSLDLKTNNTQDQTRINAVINGEGSLRNYPFSLESNALYTSKTIELNRFLLKSGDSHIEASALIDTNKMLSAQWMINSKQLQELAPDIRGSLQSKGLVESIPTTKQTVSNLSPKVIASFKASSLVLDDNQFDNINANIDIDWSSNQTTSKNQIDLNITNLVTDAIRVPSASIKIDGKPEQHRLNTDIKTDKGNIDLFISGAFSNASKQAHISDQAKWRFSIDKASLAPKELAPLVLEGEAKGLITASEQLLHQHCWLANIQQQKKATLCLGGKQSNGNLDAEFSILHFPTDYFTPLMPEGLSWTKTKINGDGKLALSSSSHLDTSIELNTSAGELTWVHNQNNDGARSQEQSTTTASSSQTLALGAGTLSIISQAKKITASLHLPVEQQTGLKGNITIANNQKALIERPLNGELQLELDELSPFVSFIPDASELKGNLDSAWKIGGSIKAPWLDGQLALNNAQVRLNGPGIFLEKINLNLVGTQQNGIHYTAIATSDGGILEANGKMQLNPKGPSVELKVKGNQFQVINTEEATAYASPDLLITSEDQRVNIEGKLTIPKATIAPKKLPPSVVTASEDQVIITNKGSPDANSSKQNISMDIDLVLGNQVLVDAFGFKGRTQGALQLTKADEGPTLANGKINILEGEYRAFGQGLVIDKGEVLYADSPINKPGIDIKALRRPAEGITVGVLARGSVTKPDLSIFSEPTMTQTEQLSWLVLGRSPEQSSDGENNAINQLLLSFSLSKGDSYLNNLKDTFQLDTLNIKTGSGEAGAASDNDLAELVLGKYLSPDLYVSYGIGLFKPVNVLSLEYSLGKRWKLKSETSSESSGGDLVYTIER